MGARAGPWDGSDDVLKSRETIDETAAHNCYNYFGKC